MDNIVDVKLGQSLPPEVWLQAADNLEEAFPLIAGILKQINKDGKGEEDASDFMDDAALALIALRYVGNFAPEQCRFIPLEGLKGD